MSKKRLVIGIIILCGILLVKIAYDINLIPHKKYYNDYFQIETIKSKTDKDNDGINDQLDILENTKKYLSTKPKYKSVYYATGYPSDEYGVCTDVVAFALLNAGYDIKELLNNDVINYQEEYEIDIIDKNIDFRRVNNLNTYLKRNAISLTLDIMDIKNWQGGDIVVFSRHIGIISDARNKKGIPFVFHHAYKNQISYEEDILEREEKNIIGHYRMSK